MIWKPRVQKQGAPPERVIIVLAACSRNRCSFKADDRSGNRMVNKRNPPAQRNIYSGDRMVNKQDAPSEQENDFGKPDVL